VLAHAGWEREPDRPERAEAALPVVRGGQLLGVLSMRDVLDAETHRAEVTGGPPT
jgi:CBS domain-containing protein